jgi:MATE family multidrug resistance protein
MANGVNALLSAAILWSRNNRMVYKTAVPQLARWPELRQLLWVALPLGIGDFIEIASFSLFFALLARLGTEVLAANQIALQFMSISFTFGIAINMAASSLVAQYLGAKRPDLAEKAAYRAVVVAMIGMGLIGLSYLIAPTALIGIFSEDEKVITAGVTILKLVALYQIFDAIGIVLAGALNGAGDTRFTMWGRIILAWGMFIPLTWVMLFVLETGVWGAWLSALIYLGGLACLYLFRFRAGHWKNIELA